MAALWMFLVRPRNLPHIQFGLMVLLTAALGLGYAIGPVAAGTVIKPPDWEATHAGRLVIEFEGGDVAEEIGRVLSKFAATPGVIPARPYMIQRESAGGCALLENTLKVAPYHCGQKAVDALLAFSTAQSTGGLDAKLGIGDTISVPDIIAEAYVFRRTFDLKRDKQRTEFNRLTQNPTWQKLSRSESQFKANAAGKASDAPAYEPKGIVTIEFNGLRWFALIKDPAVMAKAEVLALDINRPNVSIYVEHATTLRSTEPRKFSEINPTIFFNRCRDGLDVTNMKGSYRKYFMSDYDPRNAFQCQPQSAEPPEVIVIDSMVALHSDLPVPNPSASPSSLSTPVSTSSCPKSSSWNSDLHHGTYLAGIIASRGDSSGFVGVNPDTVIGNIVWGKGAQDHYLSDEIRHRYKQNQPQVFLFASNFIGLGETKKNPEVSERIWAKIGDEYSETDLKNREVRISAIQINKMITNNLRPIFVVAAGQNSNADIDSKGDELRLTSALSPQNIGDYNNIIVVTACTQCDKDHAAGLWNKANYGAFGAHLVDLAAPGGEQIPGIIDEKAMGAPPFGGTSAAAAFTAGVASRMLACHPDYYLKRPGRVKERLLLTARANIREDDREKVPGGTVDPELALINPEKSWLKLAGREEMLEVKAFRHWCSRSLTLQQENDQDEAVALRKVRRITGSGPSSYIMRELTEDDTLGSTILALNVKGPGQADGQEAVAAVELDERGPCKLRLGDIQDLILQSELPGQKKDSACAKIRECFP